MSKSEAMSIAEEILGKLDGVKVAPPESKMPKPETVAVLQPELFESDWEKFDDEADICYRLYSKLFNKGVPPISVPDHLVACFRGYDNVDEPDPSFIYSGSNFEWFSYSMTNNVKVLSVGPTGCGKTKGAEQFAAVTGRPCLRVDHTQELDKVQVFGSTHILEDGSTGFVPGDLPLSASRPTVVILDEVSRATGGANMMYKRMLDRGIIYLPEMKAAGEKAITPVAHWVLCGTDNTKGDGEDMDKYPMSNVQDAAFRNAWGVLLEDDYLKQEQEEELIRSMSPDMDNKHVRYLAVFSKLMHTGFLKGEINTAFSPRQLQTICKFVNGGVPMRVAVEKSYINFCSKSEQSDVRESYKAAFG